MTSRGTDQACEGSLPEPAYENRESSSSPKVEDDISSSTPDPEFSNRQSSKNGRSLARAVSDPKLILPSTRNDGRGRTEYSGRNREASLPAPDFKKERKDRGPSSCLFRGHDHSQRLVEEFDILRNLQGKQFSCISFLKTNYNVKLPPPCFTSAIQT